MHLRPLGFSRPARQGRQSILFFAQSYAFAAMSPFWTPEHHPSLHGHGPGVKATNPKNLLPGDAERTRPPQGPRVLVPSLGTTEPFHCATPRATSAPWEGWWRGAGETARKQPRRGKPEIPVALGEEH